MCDEGAKVTRAVETVLGLPSSSTVTVCAVAGKMLYGPADFVINFDFAEPANKLEVFFALSGGLSKKTSCHG